MERADGFGETECHLVRIEMRSRVLKKIRFGHRPRCLMPRQDLQQLLRQIKLLEKTIVQKLEAEQTNAKVIAELSVHRENKSREASRGGAGAPLRLPAFPLLPGSPTPPGRFFPEQLIDFFQSGKGVTLGSPIEGMSPLGSGLAATR